MALTVPSLDRLARHLRVDSVEEAGWSEETANDELQHATDLMSEATGLEGDPTDARGARLVTRGILAMTHALLVRGDDRDKEYSIFASERIGSYSYQIAQGEQTGIADFDVAVEWVTDQDDTLNAVSVTSSTVFTDPNPAAQQDYDEYPYHHPRVPYDVTRTQDPA